MEQATPDLLAEFEKTVDYTRASTGARLANYIIDMLAVQAISYGTGLLLGLLIEWAVAYDESITMDGFGWDVFYFFFGIGLSIGYFTVMEYASKGRTLGKLITGTQAIREDGDDLTFKNALLRSLCRFIPLEPFSGLNGNPWHDRLTKTFVIRRR